MIGSPVCGFLPLRAGLCLTSYEPKPENKTLLSFSNASLISSM